MFAERVTLNINSGFSLSGRIENAKKMRLHKFPIIKIFNHRENNFKGR
jgi:hypothetical protein